MWWWTIQDGKQHAVEPARAVLRIADPAGRPLRWVAVRGPLGNRADHEALVAARQAGCRAVGITSYLTFPGPRHRDERDYGEICEGWFHCFADPDRLLPPGPRLLLAESDFTDPRIVDAARLGRPRSHLLAADVAYVSTSARWKRPAKGWSLAAACAQRLVAAGLTMLVLGSGPDENFPLAPGIHFAGELPWQELLATLAGCRVLLAPNGEDPSPRALAEALCLDVPVVVNRGILGGWAYVNAFTGRFFDGPDDVVDAVAATLGTHRRPRTWFMQHHGPGHAGARALIFLRALDPGISDVSHVTFRPLETPATR
jgi:glycosyltransferase involved in cell wall biosynthesis